MKKKLLFVLEEVIVLAVQLEKKRMDTYNLLGIRIRKTEQVPDLPFRSCC